MFPHLYGFRANVSLLQESASKELLKILDKCEGSKVSSIYLYCSLDSISTLKQQHSIDEFIIDDLGNRVG